MYDIVVCTLTRAGGRYEGGPRGRGGGLQARETLHVRAVDRVELHAVTFTRIETRLPHISLA